MACDLVWTGDEDEDENEDEAVDEYSAAIIPGAQSLRWSRREFSLDLITAHNTKSIHRRGRGRRHLLYCGEWDRNEHGTREVGHGTWAGDEEPEKSSSLTGHPSQPYGSRLQCRYISTALLAARHWSPPPRN